MINDTREYKKKLSEAEEKIYQLEHKLDIATELNHKLFKSFNEQAQYLKQLEALTFNRNEKEREI